MNTLISRLLDVCSPSLLAFCSHLLSPQLDPEARPAIFEIKAAIKALSQGEPLPPYELSEIAQQRKEERRLSEMRRANQTQKKAAPLPTREHVPLAANSVAARRLAAKRSGVSTGGDVIGSVPHPGYASAAPSSSGGADFFFDDSAPIAAAAPAASASTAHELDFFGASSAPAPAVVSSSASASSAKVSASNDFFDAFSTPAAAPAAPSAPAPAHDLFGSGDLFMTTATTAPTPSQQQPSAAVAATSSFDAFGSGSNSLLSDMSFVTAPPPTLEEKAKNVLNLFDAHPPHAGGRPAVDPYATLMPSGPGPNMGYQPRPMGAPPSMGYGMGPGPQGGGMMMMGGAGLGRPQQPSYQHQQQQQQQARDPFGSLSGFDAFKK
jgi:hypothetical protein